MNRNSTTNLLKVLVFCLTLVLSYALFSNWDAFEKWLGSLF